MTIYEGKDYKEICEKAAEIIASEIRMNPRAVLGLSTGSTPIGVYDRLAKWYEQGQLDFSKVTTINLDEYKGLGEEHEQFNPHRICFFWHFFFLSEKPGVRFERALC